MRTAGFGACPFSWNVDDPEFATELSDGSGRPGASMVLNAISVWVGLHEHAPTIAEAALTFNLTPELIRVAIGENGWLFINGEGRLEHDGA